MEDIYNINIGNELEHIREKFKLAKKTYIENSEELQEKYFNERKLLIKELFKAQNSLEHSHQEAISLRSELDQALNFIKRLASASPHAWLGSSLHIENLGIIDGVKTLQWRIHDLYLSKRHHKYLVFKTILIDGMAGIVIQKEAGKNPDHPLSRWPTTFSKENKITVFPTSTLLHGKSNPSLASFGSSDWALVCELADSLLSYLTHCQDQIKIDYIHELIEGVKRLKEALNNYPPVLRFDQVSLTKLVHNGAYCGLLILLNNVSQGGKSWPSLTYTLSSVDESGQCFGSHPRIEFPRSTAGFFERWFAEAVDERGERLELRFAAPNQMDTNIWNKLSETDQVRLTSLLAVLEVQILELRDKQPNMEWEKWIALGASMRKILANTMRAAQTTTLN